MNTDNLNIYYLISFYTSIFYGDINTDFYSERYYQIGEQGMQIQMIYIEDQAIKF